jgi:hypothetical protein
VIAHLGATEYTEFLELAERYERVHPDTTMAFTDFTGTVPHTRPRCCLACALGDKVLLGSDFPNIFTRTLTSWRRWPD